MCCANNVVIMQTEQLRCIETLEEKLHASEGWIQDLEHSLRPTSSSRNSPFAIEFNPLSGELEPTRVIDLS